MKSAKYIILPVDLKADLSLAKRIWQALEPIKNEKTVIQPVTILNREDAAIGKALRSQIGNLRKATERHLAEQLSAMGMFGLVKPKVLHADGSSNQRAVDALLSYAKKAGCDLIALSSHSKKGLQRVFLGSFAETLSLQSPIPLLVVNPSYRAATTRGDKVLFPTDFSSESKDALGTLLHNLADEDQAIVLYHTLVPPEPWMSAPFTAYPIPQSAIDQMVKEAKNRARQWCDEVKKMGFKCEAIVDRKSVNAVNGIVQLAKKSGATMIAMASRSGKAGAILLGSITREVLRNSPQPVWIIHPEKRAQSGKVLRFKKPKTSSSARSTNGRTELLY